MDFRRLFLLCVVASLGLSSYAEAQDTKSSGSNDNTGSSGNTGTVENKDEAQKTKSSGSNDNTGSSGISGTVENEAEAQKTKSSGSNDNTGSSGNTGTSGLDLFDSETGSNSGEEIDSVGSKSQSNEKNKNTGKGGKKTTKIPTAEIKPLKNVSKVKIVKKTREIQLNTRTKERTTKTCPNICGPNAQCDKRTGTCTCLNGFTGDGTTCTQACMCSAVGDPHYTQYDAAGCKNCKLHFQGPCMYVLTERDVAEKPECNFKVEVQNEYRDGDTSVSVLQYAVVTLPEEQSVVLGPRQLLTVNGMTVQPPHPGIGFTVTYTDKIYKLTTDCSVIVEFDGNNKLYVRVPHALGQNLNGLCGNCNGNSTDDCMDPSGNNFNTNGKCDVEHLGHSWLVQQKDQLPICFAPDLQAAIESTCDTDSRTIAEASCGFLNFATAKGSFSTEAFDALSNEHKDFVRENAAELLDDCVFDACEDVVNDRDPSRSACGYFEAFDEVLFAMGITLPEWRTATQCVPVCGANEEYYAVLPIEVNCVENHLASATTARSGCACSMGFVRSGTKCIPENECGCLFVDTYINKGDRVYAPNCIDVFECLGDNNLIKVESRPACHQNATCQVNRELGIYDCVCNAQLVGDGRDQCIGGCGPNNDLCHPQAECVTTGRGNKRRQACRCKEGLEGDGIETCERTCLCSLWGDPHFTNFNQLKYNFQGPCTYKLFELDNGKPCHMTVFIKNKITSKGTASVAKEMYIYLFGSEIVIRSDENKKVRINDEDISLAEEIDMHDFTVMDDGKYVVVKNNFCGLSAGYDGAGKGFVSLPAVFGLDPTGLCGQCDGKKNRMLDADGIDRYNQNNWQTIVGNSFLVDNPFYPNETGCTVPPDPDAEQCARAVTEKASTECEVIRKPDGPLGECVKKLANETTQALFDGCVFDYCQENVREREADDIVCASSALLAELCNQNGEMPEWRSETFCPAGVLCPAEKNLRYTTNLDQERPTCADPRGKGKRRHRPEEGCECSKPELMFTGHECVPQEECGCTTKVVGPDGKKITTYMKIGETIVLKGCKFQVKCVKGKRGRAQAKQSRVDQSNKCSRDEQCALDQGAYKCIPKTQSVKKRTPVGDKKKKEKKQKKDKKDKDGKKPPPNKPQPLNQQQPPKPQQQQQQQPLQQPQQPQAVQPPNRLPSAPNTQKPVVVKPPSAPRPLPSGPLPEILEPLQQQPQILPSKPNTQKPVVVQPPSAPGPLPSGPLPEILEPLQQQPQILPSEPLTNAPVLVNPPPTPVPVPSEPLPNDAAQPVPCAEEAKTQAPTLPPKPDQLLQAECLQEGDDTGLQYFGTMSNTAEGFTCQHWRDQMPHAHNYLHLKDELNYCRNRPLSGVDGKALPWCYTTDPNKEWEYCNIPSCKTPQEETGEAIPPAVENPPKPVDPGCYHMNDSGASYNGPAAHDAQGLPCELWSKNGFSDIEGNFCRNPQPSSHDRPFCFVEGRKSSCDIKLCEEPKETPETTPECVVDHNVSPCGAELLLTGSCEHKFRFANQCQLEVKQLTRSSYLVYDATTETTVKLEYQTANNRHFSQKCGLVQIKELNKVRIIIPTCGMCAQAIANHLSPNANTQVDSIPSDGFCQSGA